MKELDDRIFFILPGITPSQSASAMTMGSKAFGLTRLASVGLQVPPAFVLGTTLCREYFEHGGRLPEQTRALLETGLSRLEEATGRKFGSPRHPLLVSVRSGAPVSMPGMMDTLLNVGLCEANIGGLLRSTGNPRLVRDCYRRLIRDFMVVAHGASASDFDAIVSRECAQLGLTSARELDSASLGRIGQESLELALAFPQAPLDQLEAAVEAVFRSWAGEKARHYRRINHIPEEMGTAITVQAMVYGNSGSLSGSGVGFTRDPSTGEDRLYLDFLFNSQGEDVVSGRHTVGDTEHLPERLPRVAAELQRIKGVLEGEFRDVQDFEFTVENGRLYLLQTRNAKRTPWAALRTAVAMVHQEIITAAEALNRLQGLQLDTVERVCVVTSESTVPLAKAVPAGLGVATGFAVFDVRRAAEWAAEGKPVILLRPDIFTDDIEGIAAATGVLTASGGRTSHAAVVARQLGKVCLVGCTALQLRPDKTGAHIGGGRIAEGDELTLDGNTGYVYRGRLEVIHERPQAELAQLERWRTAAAARR
ncbi:MAG TPA: PEP/pyruvate-binding domain-containing protein [Steroidobacteraceae bacterium]